jgi:hypothetical protein
MRKHLGGYAPTKGKRKIKSLVEKQDTKKPVKKYQTI